MWNLMRKTEITDCTKLAVWTCAKYAIWTSEKDDQNRQSYFRMCMQSEERQSGVCEECRFRVRFQVSSDGGGAVWWRPGAKLFVFVDVLDQMLCSLSPESRGVNSWWLGWMVSWGMQVALSLHLRVGGKLYPTVIWADFTPRSIFSATVQPPYHSKSGHQDALHCAAIECSGQFCPPQVPHQIEAADGFS